MFFVKTPKFLSVVVFLQVCLFCLGWKLFQLGKKNSYQADVVVIPKYSLLLHQQKTVLLIATS